MEHIGFAVILVAQKRGFALASVGGNETKPTEFDGIMAKVLSICQGIMRNDHDRKFSRSHELEFYFELVELGEIPEKPKRRFSLSKFLSCFTRPLQYGIVVELGYCIAKLLQL